VIGLIKECLGKLTHFLESIYFSRYGQLYSIVRFPLLIGPTVLRKTLASCNSLSNLKVDITLVLHAKK